MSSRQHWLPQVESDFPFYVDFLQNSKVLVLDLQKAYRFGFSVCKKLQETARGKLWLLAMLSGKLEPFGVKMICGRKFSRAGLLPER